MPPLLLSLRFAPLFWCQFFSAFADLFLKTALVFLILFRPNSVDAGALITLASAIFIAPFFFLSGLGGEMADRYDKALIAQRLKLAEIAVSAIAVAGFALNSIVVLFVSLAGFGVIGALFGPIKYGILPDHLRTEQLPTANALVEGATFIAILTGTIAGGIAASNGGDVWICSGLMMGFALACWGSSLLIPPTGEGAPQLKIRANIVASTMNMLRHLRADARLWWRGLVTSWFWLLGIVVTSLLPTLIKTPIGGNELTVTIFLAVFSVAIGAGSGIAAWIAHGRIVLWPTLLAAVLLGVFLLDIGIATIGRPDTTALLPPAEVFTSLLGIRTLLDIAGFAASGGLFIVPAFAAVQSWAGPDYRARTIAAVNVINAAFMAGATFGIAALQKTGVTIPVLFLSLGVTTLLVALAIWRTMPKVD